MSAVFQNSSRSKALVIIGKYWNTTPCFEANVRRSKFLPVRILSRSIRDNFEIVLHFRCVRLRFHQKIPLIPGLDRDAWRALRERFGFLDAGHRLS